MSDTSPTSYIPQRYMAMFLGDGMSPRAAWEQLRGASVAASNEVACASLTTLFLALQCLMEVKPIPAEWQANGWERTSARHRRIYNHSESQVSEPVLPRPKRKEYRQKASLGISCVLIGLCLSQSFKHMELQKQVVCTSSSSF